MSYAMRFTSIRLLIAILLGLFLILGVHANDSTRSINQVDTITVDSDAWPVRCEAKKK
ncbi:MAG: hypothetical protein M3R08_04825 [Bacteroidota bacterium]|nr:hypothetical protein [Bacteroidota bacterium]